MTGTDFFISNLSKLSHDGQTVFGIAFASKTPLPISLLADPQIFFQASETSIIKALINVTTFNPASQLVFIAGIFLLTFVGKCATHAIA
jgi:hypothetical protein